MKSAQTSLPVATIALCFLAGCSLFRTAPESAKVTARIERVDNQKGDNLFPAGLLRVNSVTDLTLIRLNDPSNEQRRLDLILAGLPYTPSVDGAVGDTIEFEYDEAIPFNGELDIKHIRSLRVTKKAG